MPVKENALRHDTVEGAFLFHKGSEEFVKIGQ